VVRVSNENVAARVRGQDLGGNKTDSEGSAYAADAYPTNEGSFLWLRDRAKIKIDKIRSVQ
jgi:hypothetical protein